MCRARTPGARLALSEVVATRAVIPARWSVAARVRVAGVGTGLHYRCLVRGMMGQGRPLLWCGWKVRQPAWDLAEVVVGVDEHEPCRAVSDVIAFLYALPGINSEVAAE